MTEKNETRRRGRPAKAAESRKRNYLSLRLRDDTKVALERGAALNGRSLSEEMEARLERSLSEEDALGDPRTAAVLCIQAAAVRIAKAAGPERHWLDDYELFCIVIKQWRDHLDDLETRRPPAPEGLKQRADFWVSEIQKAHEAGNRDRVTEAVKSLRESGLPSLLLDQALFVAGQITGIPAWMLRGELRLGPPIEIQWPTPGRRKRTRRGM